LKFRREKLNSRYWRSQDKTIMSSLFSKIVAGEIPAYKVAETEDYLAFLDINPLVEGHVLVIPKKEVDYIFDLDEATYLGLMSFGKSVAAAIERAIPCLRVGIAVIGLEVPHAHVHLVPLNDMDDINFSRKKLKFSIDEMSATADKIRNQYS
jgi:histidine triad (HIT) family protein